MSRRNWVNLFSSNEPLELSNDLERGYEAALLIQSLELEYYGAADAADAYDDLHVRYN